MRLSLILFVIGILCIVSGVTQTLSSGCDKKPRVKIVPRHVYDEIIQNSTVNVTPSNIFQDISKNTR